MAERSDGSLETDLLDMRAAASVAGRHPETVRRWVWSGRLAARRRGNRLLVAREDVEALVDSGQKSALTLAEWAEQARASHESAAPSGTRRSAADLVIEDRTRRAEA